MSLDKWTIDNTPDLRDKLIIVTGGNSGVGFESVKAFTANGAEVIMACRNLSRGEAAKQQIFLENPKANILVMELDLMDLNSIKNFASVFHKKYTKLDILMNNAGIMAVPYGLTKDGFESQMGTNHLGHFALTGLLLDLIAKTPGSRVVNVSSNSHRQGIMDFENFLYIKPKSYAPMKAYARSKLANLLFTYELQRVFESKGLDCISVAAHPGTCQTNLMQHMEGKLLFSLLRPIVSFMIQSAAMGALPQIRASADSRVKGGEYYGPTGFRELSGYPVLVQSNKASHHRESAGKLWDISEKLTGVKYLY